MSHNWAALATQGDKQNQARDILNGMSHYRIDPTRIKIKDTARVVRGGQGVVVVGTLIPPEALEETSIKSLEELTLKASLDGKAFNLASEAIRKQILEREVAVKKLEWPCNDAEESTKFFKSFVTELSLIAPLSHPNIIEFLGFVEDEKKGNAWIILPWEANRNVREFLQSGEWDIPERISLIQDTANGLRYLHTHNPPICHGDLKSLNILVNSSYRAVITDFGSARIRRDAAPEKQSETPCQVLVNGDMIAAELNPPRVKFNVSTLDLTLTGPIFSLRWTAPEVLSDQMQDLPSDMWAIGWICWEIITGRIPFEGVNNEAVIITHALHGKLPAVRHDPRLSHVLMLCSLMSDCWLSQPAKRIDASTFQKKVSMVPSETPLPSNAEHHKPRSARLLFKLGTMHAIQRGWAQAKSHFMSAIEVATQTKDEVVMARALDGLGEVYQMGWEFQEAECSYRRAYEICCRIGDILGVANALLGLAEANRTRGRHQEAEKAFDAAHKISSLIGNDLGAACALVGLGNIYRARSKHQEAAKAFNTAHQVSSRIGDDWGAANALLGLGITHRTQLKYREAEKAFNAAHEILSRIGSDSGAAKALVCLANALRAQSREQEAEKTLNAAQEIYSRTSNPGGTANVLLILGTMYCRQSRVQEAEKALNTAHEMHSGIGNHFGVASTLVSLGRTYLTLSKFQEAEKALNTALAIHSRMGNDGGAADARFSLGITYYAQSRNQEAEKALSAAHEIYLRIGRDLNAANASCALGANYRAQSKHREAGEAFSTAHEIYSGIGNDLGATNALASLAQTYHSPSKDPAE